MMIESPTAFKSIVACCCLIVLIIDSRSPIPAASPTGTVLAGGVLTGVLAGICLLERSFGALVLGAWVGGTLLALLGAALPAETGLAGPVTQSKADLSCLVKDCE